jgi:hypothetical protein
MQGFGNSGLTTEYGEFASQTPSELHGVKKKTVKLHEDYRSNLRFAVEEGRER